MKKKKKFNLSKYVLKERSSVFEHNEFKKEFLLFLKNEKNEEPLNFITECENITSLFNVKEKINKIYEIYNDFIKENSRFEINIGSDTKKIVTEKLELQKEEKGNENWILKEDIDKFFDNVGKKKYFFLIK
jgi:hypothetical protein